MSIALNGFAVFKSIGKNAELFKQLRNEVDKQARAFFSKTLKNKETTLDIFREMYRAFSKDNFELLVEGMKDAELKSAIAKFDRYHPESKSGSATWRRQRLLALASGEAETPTPAKSKKDIKTLGPLSKSKVAETYAAGGEQQKKKRAKK